MRTRSTLEIAVRDWLNREDQSVVNRTPDFISLAEVRLFSRLRVRENEATAVLTPDSSAMVPVPASLSEVKVFTFGGESLEYKSDQAYFRRGERDITGEASCYSRIGDKYAIWPFPDGSTNTVTLYYYADQVLGTGANDTTPVLTASPGLYLFGALIAAEPYLKNKDKLNEWKTEYGEAYADITGKTWGSEFAGSTNTVQSAYHD